DDVRCKLGNGCPPGSEKAFSPDAAAPAPIANPAANTAFTMSNAPCDATNLGGISFISDQFAPFGAVYQVDVAGKHICRFYEDGMGIYSIAWSPDGQRLAYVNSGGLAVIDYDGTHKVTLFDGDVRHEALDWSPDSKQIVFAAY